MTIRTRFAPSPTGALHLGSARTALFAYLFARHHGGEFLLRIEDTDRQRSTEESLVSILESLHWLGIDHDGEIVYQSKRFRRYQQIVEQLLASGHAYRCYCSKERLDQLRANQLANKQKPRYDGHCRDHDHSHDATQPFVVRLKNPKTGTVTFQDLVLGEISFQNDELDDLILVRSDGNPTYQLTVVVDDMDMAITHVIRGQDHVNNTPRQLNLFQALGKKPPLYGHLPMIHGDDGKKLSKRHGATDVMSYHDQGYLPEALMNFLVRLGWSHGDDEIFTKNQMKALFNIEKLTKSPAILSWDKLLWFNQYYLNHLPTFKLCEPFNQQLQQQSLHMLDGPAITELFDLQLPRVKTLKELVDKSRYFYQQQLDYDEKAVEKMLTIDAKPQLEQLITDFGALANWQKATIGEVVKQVADQYQLKLSKLCPLIRVAVTGGNVSPAINDTLWLIGKERVISRLKKALNLLT